MRLVLPRPVVGLIKPESLPLQSNMEGRMFILTLLISQENLKRIWWSFHHVVLCSVENF